MKNTLVLQNPPILKSQDYPEKYIHQIKGVWENPEQVPDAVLYYILLFQYRALY